MHKNPKLNV